MSHIDIPYHTIPCAKRLPGEELNTGRLEQRERHTTWQQSYLGHVFRVRDEVTNAILGEYTVKFSAINVVGESLPRLQPRDGIPQLVERRYVIMSMYVCMYV